ncbi:MAG: hypothetical protein H6745_04860 [Deltaproteobacteria bacterium]|nr:hypothetical protein [Deltaproteobacteria bacterium]
MAMTKSCPICGTELEGYAETTAEDGETTHVYECEICGRYAMSDEVEDLAAHMSDDVKWNVMARLETRSIDKAPDGTMVLEPSDFDAPKGLH